MLIRSSYLKIFLRLIRKLKLFIRSRITVVVIRVTVEGAIDFETSTEDVTEPFTDFTEVPPPPPPAGGGGNTLRNALVIVCWVVVC